MTRKRKTLTGCYRCQTKCGGADCRICQGRMLCGRCNPANSRPYWPEVHQEPSHLYIPDKV